MAGTRNHKRGDAQRVALTSFNVTRNYSAAALVGDIPDPEPPRPLTAVAAKVRNVGLPHDADTEALRAVPAREYIPALTQREVLRGFAQCPFHKGGASARRRCPSAGRTRRCGCASAATRAATSFTMAARMWGLDERKTSRPSRPSLKETLR